MPPKSPHLEPNADLQTTGKQLSDYIKNYRAAEGLSIEQRDVRIASITRQVIFNCSPEEIELYLSQVEFGTAYGGALCAIVKHFAKTDPQRAARLLSAEKGGLYAVIAAKAWAREVELVPELEKLIVSLPEALSRSFADAALLKVANTDMESALALIDNFRALYPDKINTVKSLLKNVGGVDPARSATIILEMGIEHFDDPTIAEVAQDWTRKDSRSAWDWVSALPDGDLKLTAGTAVVKELSTSSPNTTAELLKTIEPSSFKDSMVAAFCSILSLRSPTDAFEWALSVQNVELRKRLLQVSLRQIEIYEPDNIESFTARAGLSEK